MRAAAWLLVPFALGAWVTTFILGFGACFAHGPDIWRLAAASVVGFVLALILTALAVIGTLATFALEES